MGKQRRRRSGRPHDPNAKRNQSTRAGRGQGADPGTAELRAKRAALSAGSIDVVELAKKIEKDPQRATPGVGFDFVLDVLFARRIITQDMRDEGLRFAMLSWWRYGTPHASCQAVYERMICGVLGEDFVPRVADLDPEAQEEHQKRIAANKRRHDRMVEALCKVGGRVFRGVKNAAVFLEMPRFLMHEASGDFPSSQDLVERARLVAGLEALVRIRDEEDRYHRQRRARGEVAATAAGDKTKGVFTY